MTAGPRPATIAADRAGHTSASASAAARAARFSRSGGAAARTAACSAGLTQTAGGVPAASMASSPARSRASTADQAASGSAAQTPSLLRYWQVADAVNTVPGIAWPSSSAASASCGQVPPSGASCPACSADSAPGDRRRGQRAGAGRGELRPPPGEVVPVLAAADARADDHRGGLGQRRRLAAQLAGQADRAAALVRVGGQPARQVVQRLPRAEPGHHENPHPVLAGDSRDVRGGDQHPAGRPGRPSARPGPPRPAGHRAPPATAGWSPPARPANRAATASASPA